VAADAAGGRSLNEAVGTMLLARRIVMMNGELDHTRASEIAATLMTLDALGDEHVELRINSSSGSMETGLVLIDVIEVLGVPVHTVGMGEIGGGVVGVLAAGAERALSPRARLHLREPDIEVAGRASDIERALAERAARRDVFLGFLARRTGRPVAEIDAEWTIGPYVSAEDARTLGYVRGLVG
jgi:ATP-dependent Clp protease protease subunit